MEMNNVSVNKQKRGRTERATFPIGNQAVSTIEPDWEYNTAKGRWDQSHFVRCVFEEFRQAHAKTLNYQTGNIEQEEKEAPDGMFLDRLWEALH